MNFKFTYILGLLLFLTVFVQETKAQDPQFSQFYAAPLNLNPAMTGVFEGHFRVAANYREQWRSLIADDPFRTISASFDMRQHIVGDDYFAFGVNVLRDEAGTSRLNQKRAYLNLSYMKQMGGGYRSNEQYLIAGVQAGVGQNSVEFSELWFSQQFNMISEVPDPGSLPSMESAIIGENITTDMFLDLNAGLLWYSLMADNMSIYAGGSISHLNAPRISFLGDDGEILYMRWAAHVGGELPFSSQFSVLPAVAVTGQGPSLQATFGGNFRYNNHDWREVALRMGMWSRLANKQESGLIMDAIIFTAVLELEFVDIGISYDITSSSLKTANNSRGAYELSVIYTHPAPRPRGQVKCPKF